MQTTTAQTILDGAGVAIGWDLTQLEARQKQMRREAFSLALQEVWEAWWWEELMLSVPLPAATVYSATAATTADTFYYFPATQQFYQCLVAATGQAPSTLNSDGSYTTNFAYWAGAESRFDDRGYADYQVGVNDANLTLGSIVRNPVDGLYYQLYAMNLIPIPNLGPTGNNASWHALIPFTPSLVVPGEVRAVARENPTLTMNCGGRAFEKTASGICLPGWHQGVPWVWYRRATPIITGDDFDPTVAYTAAPTITFN